MLHDFHLHWQRLSSQHGCDFDSLSPPGRLPLFQMLWSDACCHLSPDIPLCPCRYLLWQHERHPLGKTQPDSAFLLLQAPVLKEVHRGTTNEPGNKLVSWMLIEFARRAQLLNNPCVEDRDMVPH